MCHRMYSFYLRSDLVQKECEGHGKEYQHLLQSDACTQEAFNKHILSDLSLKVVNVQVLILSKCAI